MSQVQIEVLGQGDDSPRARVEVRNYSPREIFQKVLKTLGIFWGLALISVFLPVVHFVLVPLFFILGLVLAFRARKFRQEVIEGSVTCPHCSQVIQLKQRPVLWPHTEICPSCAFVIRLAPVEENK